MKHFTEKVAPIKNMIRSKLIPRGKNVIGLPGPDMKSYINMLNNRGYIHMDFYENDREVVRRNMTYLPDIVRMNITYSFSDILNAPVVKNTLYDLDFCARIQAVRDHINKFKDVDDMIITVSERGKKKFWSIPLFIDYMEEKYVEEYPISKNIIRFSTNKNNYRAESYCDSSQMLIITKI